MAEHLLTATLDVSDGAPTRSGCHVCRKWSYVMDSMTGVPKWALCLLLNTCWYENDGKAERYPGEADDFIRAYSVLREALIANPADDLPVPVPSL